jgi:hypothetical protein
MKYFLLVPIIAVFILAGCSKENSIIGPQSSQLHSKSQWIKIGQSSSLSSVECTNTVSKSIDGNKGGTIELTQFSFSAVLTIPKHAFKGTQVISYTVNTETASIDFQPLGMDFNKNLSLDLTFTGLNISNYKASDLSFSFLDGDNIVPVSSAYENVNIKQGFLQVLGAQISHFSRYGWSTIDDQ